MFNCWGCSSSSSVRSCLWLMILTAFHAGYCASCAAQAANSTAEGSSPASQADTLRREPLSPEESMAMIELGDPSQQVRLLASEPLVIDPVEVAFDDAGRMWVVEMRDYPFRVSDSPRGCIKVLTDSNDDGVYDQATVFVDGLEMPTGLAFWQDGLIVTLAGELVYFRDTDGDRVAETRQQWLNGFTQDNEQLRANHPRLGPDGWWYIACGLRGGEVVLGKDLQSQSNAPAQESITIGSRDIRFRPAQRSLETVTGPAQFGLAFDTLGSRFFCSNRNPAVQVVFEQAELQGNPLVGLTPSVTDVIPAGTQSSVFPLVDAWTTSNLHAGQFTAACGVYLRPLPARASIGQPQRDAVSNNLGLFEEVYACEPTGSLVKREIATRDAAALRLVNSPASDQTGEWLASRDAWFRPVNITVAPTGEIVVIDMHRAVIEHPRWVPEELKNRPDERWGDNAGRIFLVTRGSLADLPDNLRSLKAHPLRERSSEELARLLTTDNAWMRETAARLLLERQDRQVVPLLKAQWNDTDLTDVARIWSMRVASRLAGQVPGFDVFADPQHSTALVVAALRMARSQDSIDPDLDRMLLMLAENSHPTIAFEALLCMSRSPRASLSDPIFESIAESADPYLLIAAAGALREHPDRFLRSWLSTLSSRTHDKTRGPSPFIATAADKLMAAVLRLSSENKQIGLQQQLGDFILNATRDDCLLVVLASQATVLEQSPDLALRVLSEDHWARVIALAENKDAANSIRMAAIQLLGYSPRKEDLAWLSSWIREGKDPLLSDALLRAWARTQDAECDAYLLQLLESGTPRQKATAVELLGRTQNRIQMAAQRLAEQPALPKMVGPALLKQLHERARGEVKNQLSAALDALVNSDREAVLQDYQRALEIEGNRERGMAIFRERCASCHRIGDIGIDVGPDISDSRTKTTSQLLTSILDPNRAIDNNYFRFVVLTQDDEVIDGVIAEETGDALIIKGQQNAVRVVNREDIVEMKATGVSFMPEGIESQVDHQQMADLIAFIKEWRYSDNAIPGR